MHYVSFEPHFLGGLVWGSWKMIAYRAEVWCDARGCDAGNRDGIAHDDPNALPQLARNLIEIRTREGWRTVGQQHFCPLHPAGTVQPIKAEAVLCGEAEK